MAELIGSRWLVSTSCHFIYTGRYRGTAAASAALLATARRNNATWPNEVCAHSSLSIHRGLVDKRENRIALAETLFINKSRGHVTGKCLTSLALNRAVFQGSPLCLFSFLLYLDRPPWLPVDEEKKTHTSRYTHERRKQKRHAREER
jgi:hypothetical protein